MLSRIEKDQAEAEDTSTRRADFERQLALLFERIVCHQHHQNRQETSESANNSRVTAQVERRNET